MKCIMQGRLNQKLRKGEEEKMNKGKEAGIGSRCGRWEQRGKLRRGM